MKPSRPAADAALSIIVITGDGEFYARLEQIAADCKWQIRCAASVEEAEGQLGSHPSPLVICEHDPDGHWRSALRRLNVSQLKPCTLLASRVYDDYLWQEVVRNHGYDILCKFATDEQLMRRLRFAWFSLRQCRLGSLERRAIQ